jgi:hypothetical protein
MLRDNTRGADIGSVPDDAAGRREPLVITRANAPSPLKPVHPYYLAVPTFDGEGLRTGEHRFLGTLTVPALYESVLDIPVVERRVRGAIHRAGFPLESYSGQQMLEVISGLPREELFSATEERLHETAVGVLAVANQRAVRLFLRPDPFRRFLFCLIYLPRDQYTTSSRLAMSDLLQRRLGGSSVEYTARVSESRLALVHFTVQTSADAVGYAGVDVAGLQAVDHVEDDLLVVRRAAVEQVQGARGADREEVGRHVEVLADRHDDRPRQLEDRLLGGLAVVEHRGVRVEAPHAAASRVVPARRLEHRLVADGQGEVQLRRDAQVVRPAVRAVEVQPAAERQDHVRLVGGQLAGDLEVREGEVADVAVAEQLRLVLDDRGRITRGADERVPKGLVAPLADAVETRHR